MRRRVRVKEVRTLYVDAGEDGVRLDRWFKRRWPHLNHIQIQKLARSGQIRVDGARAKPDTRLAAGAQVRVPPLPDAAAGGQEAHGLSDRDIAFAKSLVLYEDDEVLALNKPSGLAVQGGTKTTAAHRPPAVRLGRGAGAAAPGAPAGPRHLRRAGAGQDARPRRPSSPAPSPRRKAKKTYWAHRGGQPKPGEGLIDLPLVKKGVGDREMVVPGRPQGARRRAGGDRVRHHLPRRRQRVAWMALRPHTGRTHQLRAHMMAIGHPILGDPKYCDDEASAELSGGLKLQLHARRLELPHPGGGTLIVEAPLSPEMKDGFDRFGFDQHEADPEPFRGGRKKR